MLFAILLASPLFAGEAIIVPGEKAKSAPFSDGKALAPREVFRLRDLGPGSSPLDGILIPETKKRLDPKEEKRRRLQEIEKKNWMVVEQGELQAEENQKNFLNVRDYSLDNLEKRDESGNLMFRPLSKDDNRRIPGQFRSSPDSQAGQRNNLPQKAASDEPETRASNIGDPQVGSHLSSDLNLKSMFETRNDSLAPRFNKSDLTLQTLLNSGASPETMRDQQTKRDEFRNFLDNPKLGSPFAGASDPINSRDLTRQPLNPTMPQSLDTVSRPNSSPSTPNTPRPSPFSPGPADLNRSLGPSPWQPWTPQQPAVSPFQKPSSFEQPLPKRKF
ncbi:MAG TPA: hypothetical protein VK615_12590 [Candidatus Binatia bacterium]|nr:hypothetical protein [Candidatus Binatia bacterium]